MARFVQTERNFAVKQPAVRVDLDGFDDPMDVIFIFK
jgi:hypothetical protein